MGTLERVAHAETSSNLQHKEHDCDVDVLGAIGMAGIKHKGYLALFRIKYLHDMDEAKNAQQQLTEWARKGLSLKGQNTKQAKHIADKVMKYWLVDTCALCSGLKYEVDPGSPYLSNRVCKRCRGTGKRPLPHSREHTDLIKELLERANNAVLQVQKQIVIKLYAD